MFLLSHYCQSRVKSNSPTDNQTSAPERALEPIKSDEISVPDAPSQEDQVVASLQVEDSSAKYSVEAEVIGLACKKCGAEQSLTAMNGQYGYYVKCGQCGTNTSMKTACPECSSTKTRVRKRGNEYWLQCECSALRKLYEQT